MSQPSDDASATIAWVNPSSLERNLAKLRDDVDGAWQAIKSIFSVVEAQDRINRSLHERLKQLEGQDGSGKEEATLS